MYTYNYNRLSVQMRYFNLWKDLIRHTLNFCHNSRAEYNKSYRARYPRKHVFLVSMSFLLMCSVSISHRYKQMYSKTARHVPRIPTLTIHTTDITNYFLIHQSPADPVDINSRGVLHVHTTVLPFVDSPSASSTRLQRQEES